MFALLYRGGSSPLPMTFCKSHVSPFSSLREAGLVQVLRLERKSSAFVMLLCQLTTAIALRHVARQIWLFTKKCGHMCKVYSRESRGMVYSAVACRCLFKVSIVALACQSAPHRSHHNYNLPLLTDPLHISHFYDYVDVTVLFRRT